MELNDYVCAFIKVSNITPFNSALPRQNKLKMYQHAVQEINEIIIDPTKEVCKSVSQPARVKRGKREITRPAPLGGHTKRGMFSKGNTKINFLNSVLLHLSSLARKPLSFSLEQFGIRIVPPQVLKRKKERSSSPVAPL
ncbi:hypothetical protein CDAR_26012 [Caerostris darwini]|uniref:Uncharacterized protein n=1 Tax=Caerostris darwini TaxID=1538125 RepID=A0AAV4PJQ0_9ARAC|nr:hypothetical protein CDAR_26012 [Caerostris darwini]